MADRPSSSGGSSRGGRGSLLEMLKTRVPGGGDQPPLPEPPRQAVETPVVGMSVGRGRASILALVKERETLDESEPLRVPRTQPGYLTAESSTPMIHHRVSAPPPTGSQGRGSLLNLLKKVQTTQEKEAGGAPIPGPSGDESSIVGKMSVLSVRQSEALSTVASEPVSRQGESGFSINLASNYINLRIKPGKGIFEYEVKYSPDIDSRPLRSKLLNQHMAALGGNKIFDGTILYLPHRLKDVETVFNSAHPMDGSTVRLRIIYKRQRNMADSIHFFNTLFNRIMKCLNQVRIGRQFFNPKGAHAIPQHRLELWPGYITAVDEYEGGLKLNIDATHRAMRMETVRDLMHDIHRKNPRDFKNAVAVDVIGTSVLTRYNNRTYRIDDIYWNKNPTMQFESSDGSKISLLQYYKNHWNIEVKDQEQPLLVHRAKKRTSTNEVQENLVMLIPELCYLAGLTDTLRSDNRVMRDLATVTRVTPDARRNVIREFIRQVQSNDACREILASWGLEMESDIIKIVGRVLEPEIIQFGNNKTFKCRANADWTGIATSSPMLSTPHLNKWFLIHCQRDMRACKDFLTTLVKVGPAMGMNINQPNVITLSDDKTESFIRELRKYIDPSAEIVVIIVPTLRNDRYAAIKKICCVEMPIASQVIIARTIARPDKLKAVTEKIALQMNCKLGGSLWALSMPFKSCMVCGMDVYHAGAAQGSHGSVAAFVASLDQHLTTWYSKTCLQQPHQELVDLLKICLVASLNKYRAKNGKLPDRVILFRDGVGDGQLNTVARYEVKQLQNAFIDVAPNYKPKMSIVIVQKRINTRLFKQDGSSLSNPPAGTIVDSSVTRRNWYDFFLVPQSVRQGSVSPTHYIVIHDEAMKTDHLQRLTYKLCHLYYNWPGTIRVPAPCQYAHKLAYLVGQSIRVAPSETLADRLFYL